MLASRQMQFASKTRCGRASAVTGLSAHAVMMWLTFASHKTRLPRSADELGHHPYRSTGRVVSVKDRVDVPSCLFPGTVNQHTISITPLLHSI